AGELLGGRVGEGLEYLVGGELAHLLRRGVGELAPAVPDVAVPEAGEGVQVGTPVRVEDPGAVTPGDRDGVPGQAGHVREPVPQRWLAWGITRSWHHRASFHAGGSHVNLPAIPCQRGAQRPGAPSWPGQPMVLAPSRDSRMMSAWPEGWVGSATTCSSTCRADQRASGGNQGASGSGWAASRSGSVVTSSPVRRPPCSYRSSIPASVSPSSIWNPPAHSSSFAPIADGPSRMKLAHCRSVMATCLI